MIWAIHINQILKIPQKQQKPITITKALVSLVHKLLLNMDDGEVTIAVFLDFKKALDAIKNQILLQKLSSAGFGRKTSIPTNYFIHRNQFIRLKGNEQFNRQIQHFISDSVLWQLHKVVQCGIYKNKGE